MPCQLLPFSRSRRAVRARCRELDINSSFSQGTRCRTRVSVAARFRGEERQACVRRGACRKPGRRRASYSSRRLNALPIDAAPLISLGTGHCHVAIDDTLVPHSSGAIVEHHLPAVLAARRNDDDRAGVLFRYGNRWFRGGRLLAQRGPAARVPVVGVDEQGSAEGEVGAADGVVMDFHSEEIVALEMNPLIVESLRGMYAPFSGGIYLRKEVRVSIGEGRSFLRGKPGSFDLIILPLTETMGASVSVLSSLREDYRLTVEAFEDYLQALNPQGWIAFHLYLLPPPRAEFRLVTILQEVFKRAGKSPENHFFAMRSWGTFSLFMKKDLIQPSEIKALRSFCEQWRFDLFGGSRLSRPRPRPQRRWRRRKCSRCNTGSSQASAMRPSPVHSK